MKTKQLFTILLIATLSFNISSCAKDNSDFTLNSTSEIQNAFENPQKLKTEDFEKKVSGYGWQLVTSYEIKEDGTIDYSRDYYEDRVDSSTKNYYFATDYYISYYNDLAFGLGDVFRKQNSEYDYQTSTIYPILEDGTRGNAAFVILKVDTNILFVKQLMGLRHADNKEEYIPVYTVSAYKKMSNEDYEKMKNNHRNVEDAQKEFTE